MSEKRYQVPDGMLKAATERGEQYDGVCDKDLRVRLEAAVRWWSENPQRPTDYQFGKVITACRDSVGAVKWERGTEWMRAGMLCHEWQRQMFLAPEPQDNSAEEAAKIKHAIDTSTHRPAVLADPPMPEFDDMIETVLESHPITVERGRVHAYDTLQAVASEAYRQGQRTK